MFRPTVDSGMIGWLTGRTPRGCKHMMRGDPLGAPAMGSRHAAAT